MSPTYIKMTISEETLQNTNALDMFVCQRDITLSHLMYAIIIKLAEALIKLGTLIIKYVKKQFQNYVDHNIAANTHVDFTILNLG